MRTIKPPVTDGEGRGVAAGYWINAGLQSSATLNVLSDGHLSILTGKPRHWRVTCVDGVNGRRGTGYSF
jgi:hypothetical protein